MIITVSAVINKIIIAVIFQGMKVNVVVYLSMLYKSSYYKIRIIF